MLLDSNIIIIASKLTNIDLLNKLRATDNDYKASIITQIEVVGYHQLKSSEKLFFENFFKSILVLPINENVARKAIEMRQKRAISLADCLIAATAILNDEVLLTDNVKDYARIKELKVLSMEEFLK
jgi:toxin FitB